MKIYGAFKNKLGDQKYIKNQLISKIHSIWENIDEEQTKKYMTIY